MKRQIYEVSVKIYQYQILKSVRCSTAPQTPITPGSSLTPRRESRDSVAAVLVRLAEIASFKMSDYKDLSFNASYVLALVKRWDAS